jgi:hypothetical protein
MSMGITVAPFESPLVGHKFLSHHEFAARPSPPAGGVPGVAVGWYRFRQDARKYVVGHAATLAGDDKTVIVRR